MRFTPCIPFLLTGVLALTGCREDRPTPFEPTVNPESIELLMFTAPTVQQSDLTPFGRAGVATTPNENREGGAPATVSSDFEFDYEFKEDLDDPYDDLSRPLQQIFSPRTKTGFYTTRAWAEGAHSYVGNVGAIETSARVTLNDAHLADQLVIEQDYTPFLLDFGRTKFISAFAPVSTDHTCGLTVRGSSQHSASWQFFQGRGTSAWGEAIASSVADHASQPPCPDEINTQGTGGGDGPSGSSCYYSITYDKETGEILGVDFLFCVSSAQEV